MSDDEVIEIDDDESPDDETDLGRLRAELEARCRAASIKLETVDDPEGGGRFLKVYLPAGRDTQPLLLFTAERIRSLLGIEFEKYVLLGGYAAICSYADGVIEAEIGAAAAPSSLRYLYQRLTGARISSLGSPPEMPPFEISNSAGPEKLILGPGTAALDLLGGSSRPIPRLSLRIEGLTVSCHDHAVAVLERLSNSLFFQLDLLREVSLTLRRRRPTLRQPFPRRARRELKELEFPRTEYDREPISLYWYARGATGMPLLQFLAYYQTIEYYFPSYSQAEARRKIRNILKSPAFRAERDTDVARILLAAQASGSGFGDERSQLRATISECLEPGALRGFLTEFEERARFFSTKTVGLTDQRIQIRNLDADLRNDVADRIYDIRCKIVHTKSGGREGEVELLLPFSKEAELLYADIELIQFVAREVLVSASSPLRLGDDTVSS